MCFWTVDFTEEEREAQMRLFERHFYVPSFDAPSAVVAAELEGNNGTAKVLRDEFGVSKQELRIDTQILAVAIVQNAEKVISNDPHMTKLARGRIDDVAVPSISEQLELGLE